MRVIFTCGGTGGHINPAIAVAKFLLEKQPTAEILFVGAEDGLETSLVPKAGFAIKTVTISNFKRKLTPSAIVHNCKSLLNVMKSKKQAVRILRDFQPDVILGTGGYASYPMLRQGAKMGIPVAVHEANAVAGLTTKMASKEADKILLNFASCQDQYEPGKTTVVGMPVESDFVFGDRDKARNELGLDERPYIVSCWGSLGAREMNKIIADFMAEAVADGLPYQHTHATGSFGWKWMPQRLEDMKVPLGNGLSMVEYLFDMPRQMAAADLIIARAGAATLAEISASGTPCILVPSPNVTGNHQMKNAQVLGKAGGALVIAESDCNGKDLYQEAKRILSDDKIQQDMTHGLHQVAVIDSTQRIYDTLVQLAKKG